MKRVRGDIQNPHNTWETAVAAFQDRSPVGHVWGAISRMLYDVTEAD